MLVCEKLSVSLFVSCVVPHPSVAFYCFSPCRFLSLSRSFLVAGSNKGLTRRAWRSWLLDGKGESHSWAGQASFLAKVMSCVCSGRVVGVIFIWHKVLSYVPPGLVRERPQGLLIKCKWQVKRRGGDYEQSNKFICCSSGLCCCVCVCVCVCELIWQPQRRSHLLLRQLRLNFCGQGCNSSAVTKVDLDCLILSLWDVGFVNILNDLDD